MLLEFSDAVNWFQRDRLLEYLELARDTKWCERQIARWTELFSHWRWKHPAHTPRLVSGLMLATWVQTLWKWRPLVSVTGPSDSGKSTLFETLGEIFGFLGLRSSKSTEAGIRQAIGRSASIILCDEFESDKHRQRILELLRTSSKGDTILRGTSDQNGQAFGLKHIVWVAAIEVGLKKEPDKNRFIQLELKRPKGTRGVLDWLPEPDELADEGMKALAIALAHVQSACEIARKIRATVVARVPGRVVESYSVPVAMLTAATGGNASTAEQLLREMLTGQSFEDYSNADENELVHAILESTVHPAQDGHPCVSQCLESLEGGTNRFRKALAACGIGIVRPNKMNGRECLFLAHKLIGRSLLKDTDWKDQCLDQLLLRIPGSSRSTQRLAGALKAGILIPYDGFKAAFLGDKDTPDSVDPDPGSLGSIDDIGW